MRIIQIIEGYRKGDGVGNVVTVFDKYFASHGFETLIINRQLLVSDLASELFEPKDIVFYHFALLYDPFVKRLPCKKILVFHNITEPELLIGFDEETRVKCCAGKYDLCETSDCFDYSIVFSKYSMKCLCDNGWNKDKVFMLPIGIDMDSHNVDADEKVKETFGEKGTNVLFTGRIYPNKKQEDVIAAFSVYKKKYDPDARLFLVGSLPKGNYYPSLIDYAKRLGIFESVYFPGHVTFEEYIAYFEVADIFLCMSEHEGFCIPLVEAMYYHVPIIAYNATAVPDTLGGSGILVDEKNPDIIASVINDLMSDPGYREKIISGQNKRYNEISEQNLEKSYDLVFNKILEEGTAGYIRADRLNEQSEAEEGFRFVDMPFECPEIYENRHVFVYGAGAWGTRLYTQLSRIIEADKLHICDKAKGGKYDNDLGCMIYSPESAYDDFKDAIWIISLQDRQTMIRIALMLHEWGVDADSIKIYDKYLNAVR